MNKKKDYKTFVQMGQASSVGILMVASTAIGYFFGGWLDGKLHTDPWLMIIFTVLGVIAGFLEIAKIVIRLSK